MLQQREELHEATVAVAETLRDVHKDKGVVGFDIAGDEASFPLQPHAEAVRMCQRAGLMVTVHAGETGLASDMENLAMALSLEVDRIGHGWAIARDSGLLRRAVDQRVTFECCLTANIRPNRVRTYAAHPVRHLLKAGARVTLNSDNLMLSGTEQTLIAAPARERQAAVEHLGFQSNDLARVSINAAKAARGISEAERHVLVSDESEMATKLAHGLWARYSASMAKRPLVTGMATSWVVMTLGDGVAQAMTRESRHPAPPQHALTKETGEELFGWFDWKRNVIVSSWNGLVFAPSVQIWFAQLDRWFPGSSFRMAASKTFTNTAVMALPFNAGFLAYTMLTECMLGVRECGKDESLLQTVVDKVKHDALEIVVKSASVWAPINLINFMYVSPKFRILPTIVTSLVWNVVLSLIAHRELATPVDPAEVASPAAPTPPTPSSHSTSASASHVKVSTILM
ncbi:Adenosine deaminase, putative [Hondaea fermentalgiana]|uniref:adenosine deaminase n=1 Tax=Hondaea fermentalgiana TaxID=2315210 RepID=A0A2R5GNP9_9STRA|nr:Adenosine deaminase, putative [Hondaea fermentalgiana]|eukprot:GBG29931.1 Adenosine deaminase, putative [Hondaea fermentalgiana]